MIPYTEYLEWSEEPNPIVLNQKMNDLVLSNNKQEHLIHELKNGYVKLKSDFDNYKSSSKKENERNKFFIKREILSQILPIVDDFNRFVSIFSNEEDVVEAKGILLIYKKMNKILSKLGLSEIKTINEKFNDEFHEAITTSSNNDIENGIITEEIEKGFIMEEQIIRPAKVVVNEI